MGDGSKIEWTDRDMALAYLAGVIDSDGYISITQACRRGSLYFAATVGISGTRTEPHELAASLWGGNIHPYVPKNPRHRPQFQWSRQGDVAAEVITEVAPFLRVKADQAALALACQEHVQFGRGPDPYPWFGPDYDPTTELLEMRSDMVLMLNQSRRPVTTLDGRTWDEYPR